MRRLRFLCCRDLLELLEAPAGAAAPALGEGGFGTAGDPTRSAEELAAAVAMLILATWACHLATILKNLLVVCVKEKDSKATKKAFPKAFLSLPPSLSLFRALARLL